MRRWVSRQNPGRYTVSLPDHYKAALARRYMGWGYLGVPKTEVSQWLRRPRRVDAYTGTETEGEILLVTWGASPHCSRKFCRGSPKVEAGDLKSLIVWVRIPPPARIASLAQLGERLPCKREVNSSSLLRGSQMGELNGKALGAPQQVQKFRVRVPAPSSS